MKYAIISIDKYSSNKLTILLSKYKLNIVNKFFNYLTSNNLAELFGNSIKVIFISRNIRDIKYLFENKKNILDYGKLYNSYINQNIFDVLFIKYENLFYKKTIEALNFYTKNDNITFKLNYSSVQHTSNKYLISQIELSNNEQILQNKLDKYSHKFYLTNNILKLWSGSGFGACINIMITSCLLVENCTIEPFYVDWEKNIYYKTDIFKKYFAQPFYNDFNVEINKKCNETIKYLNSSITPRKKVPNYLLENIPLKDRNFNTTNILLPPQNRNKIKLVIDKYIKIDKKILEIANKFMDKYLDHHKIGVHIRGNGGTHGGVICMRDVLNKNKEYYYIEKLNNYINNYINNLDSNSNYIIILFTDNNYNLDKFMKLYGDKMVCYDSTRSNDDVGEIHLTKTNNLKIFEDIVIETEIMSRVDYLIHGNSNITNYVLSKNPNLKSHDIYNLFY